MVVNVYCNSFFKKPVPRQILFMGGLYFIGSEVSKWGNLKKGEIYKNPNIAATTT